MTQLDRERDGVRLVMSYHGLLKLLLHNALERLTSLTPELLLRRRGSGGGDAMAEDWDRYFMQLIKGVKVGRGLAGLYTVD